MSFLQCTEIIFKIKGVSKYAIRIEKETRMPEIGED